MISRDEALALLREHIKSDSLVKHMIGVEAAMRAYARRFGENEDEWGLTGLLHDVDYEETPEIETHAIRSAEIVSEAGFDDHVAHAVKAHNDAHGLLREDILSKTLYAVDELVGFIVAVSLVRPSRQIADVKVKSVTKKMKDKSFAAAVDRDELRKGAEELGVEFNEHVGVVLEAMKGVAADIGL
jgi:putative nucleotidyltransferase with HDIG domain